MSYQQQVNQLDQATIDKLARAVETGKWDNGEKLTDKQTENAMQAVLLWRANHSAENVDEPFKINAKGEFKIGKGVSLNQVPSEFRSETLGDIAINTKH